MLLGTCWLCLLTTPSALLADLCCCWQLDKHVHPGHATRPLAVVELEAARSPDARVRRLFVDPLGRHALLSLQTGGGGLGSLAGGPHLETYYVDGGGAEGWCWEPGGAVGLQGASGEAVPWRHSLLASGLLTSNVEPGFLNLTSVLHVQG